MTKKDNADKHQASKAKRHHTAHPEDPPLLRLLIAQATRRGDTLKALAHSLGIDYRRLAQLRSAGEDISTAHRRTLEAAATYLAVPVVVVLALRGVVTLEDFEHPGRFASGQAVQRDLERLRSDPSFAGFVPEELAKANPRVQHLVAFMYRELRGADSASTAAEQWVQSLQRTVVAAATPPTWPIG